MAKTLLGGCYANCFSSVNTGTVNFLALGMNGERAPAANVAEANCQIKLRNAGTLSLLSLNVSVNAQTASGTIVFRKNTADGNQTVSVGATTTGQFQDSTHSDTIAAGDLICVKWTAPSAFHAFSISSLVMQFDATSATATLYSSSDAYAAASVNGPTVASTTYFSPLVGTGGSSFWYNTTEANQKALIRAAGTLSNLATEIGTNTSTNAMALTQRVNGADGNGTVSVTASTTGYFEDTTHSDSIASGDLINIKAVTGAGTVNQTPISNSVLFVSGGSNHDLLGGQLQTSAAAGWTNADNFGPILGALGSTNTFVVISEALIRAQVPVALTATRMRFLIIAMTSPSSQAAFLRINGADANNTITVTASTTGTYEDSTHTDSIAANDLVCFRAAAVATGVVAPGKFGLTMSSATNATVNLTGVHGTGVARALTPNPSVTLGHVAGTAVARGLTPSVSIALAHVAATGNRGNILLGSTVNLVGVHATGVARSLLPNPAAQLHQASAAGIPHALSTMSNTNVTLTGVQAHAVARGLVPTLASPLRGVIAIGVPGTLGIYTTPITYVLANRIMRNKAVPAVGAMSNIAVTVVARLKPYGPQPRSVEVFLVGVQARGVAHPIQTSLNTSVLLVGVQATGVARPVVGVGNVV